MKRTKKDYTFNFALMYLTHYITFALLSSQRQTFLIDVGYSLNQRSLIFAAIPAITICMQLLIGYLSDRHKTIKKIIVVTVALSAISSYLFYSVGVQFFVFHFAIAILSQSFCASITDLSDVWVLESKGPSKHKYGFIRGFGSAGWSIGSFLLAKIVIAFGYPGLAMSILLLSVLLLVIMITISDDKALIDIEEAKEAIKLKDILALFSDVNYLYAIGIVFFVNLAVNMSGYIIIDKILGLGGDVMTIGYRGMIAAGFEIPLMLIGDRIHKKLGSFKMIMIGVLVHTLQFGGYFLATSNNTILIITAFQFISVPFYQIALKYLLLEMSPDHLKTTGQMTGPAIMNGLTGIIFPLISAALVAKFTLNTPFLLSIIFGIIGIIICFLLSQRVKRAQLAQS